MLVQPSTFVDKPDPINDELLYCDRQFLLHFTNDHIPVIASSIDEMSKQMCLSKKIGELGEQENMEYIRSTVNIFVLVQLISLDIMILLNACLRSDVYIERQLLIRRINVFIYEGLKKLVGWEEIDRRLMQCLSLIEKKEEKEVLTRELLALRCEGADAIRHSCTHYLNKGKDNIYLMIKFIFSMTEKTEIEKAKNFITVTSKIHKVFVADAEKLY